ncbi:reverse transcriptase domain-containing protein [Tanacetum coccineum]
MSRSPEPNPSVFSKIRRERSESPRNRLGDKGRKEGGVFRRLGVKEEMCLHTRRAATKVPDQEERSQLPGSVTMKEHLHGERYHSQRVRIVEEDTGSQDRRSKSQALRKTTYLNHGDDPEDQLKKFQAAAKVERWAMPTWCHMFNSTLTGSARVWFDDLPPESVDSYDDLKKAFLANFLQQKKCIKDPVEIHPHQAKRRGIYRRLCSKIQDLE